LTGCLNSNDIKFDREKVQEGLTFLRYCGWFQRAWTFQEICLARHAIVQAGNQKIDWNTIASGWQRVTGKAMFNDYRNIWREIRFVEMARHDACDLLLLLRSIWNRHATNKRYKAYAVLGLYHGSLFLEPDYKLSMRQALVRISRATVEETRSLDILHFAGMGHIFTPLWGPKSETLAWESKNTLDDEQDFTGGWHLPSWTPDWGSISNKEFPMRDVDLLTKLEFPELDPKFKFDVWWNGERMVAAGIALGRLLQFENPADELRPKVIILPFPKCAFNRCTGAESQWPMSPSLWKALSSCSRAKETVKTSIAEFAYSVKMHDEARCPCSKAVDRPTKSTSYNSDHGKYFLLRYPLEFGVARPLDWVVVLFGARSSMVLRADCRVQPNPWNLPHESMHTRISDNAFRPSKQETEDKPLGTFVLTDVKDDDGRGNPLDILDTHREFTQKLKHLGCLSCVYGDFEIR
jgi:hypothetical protein